MMPGGFYSFSDTVIKNYVGSTKNSALDGLTKGFAGMGRMVGSNAKECERLVEATAQELNALGL